MSNIDRILSPLVDRFLDTVATNPQGSAVISDSGTTTFAELNQLVGSLQIQIESQKPRALGIYASPSTTLIAAAWAALCSGIPYVPLSPTYPDERIRYMVQDSQVDLIIAEDDAVPELRAIVGDLSVNIDTITKPSASSVASNNASADDIAYIVYTSGSTGVPKGVMIDHRALHHQLKWLASELALVTGARIIHKTPISFDAAQWEFLASAAGAATVVAPAEAYRDPVTLLKTVREHGVTHLQAVPTLLQALIEEEGFGDANALRVIASGGEVLTIRLASDLQALLPEAKIVNLYGPTEATINASYHVFDPQMDAGSTTLAVPIGLPVPGLDFYLLSEAGKITSDSVGELAIAGPQLAVGYHKKPEETNHRFLTKTINSKRVRLYRTGDIVEKTGNVYTFLGRRDRQHKIRGHRIELGEVRNAIANHEWVRHAEVLPLLDQSGTAFGLTAFVELNPNEATLMDQGVHGDHHQSKASRTQVKAQIAGLGILNDLSGASLPLPITDGYEAQLRELAFARKTYRNFTDQTISRNTLDKLGVLVKHPRELPELSGVNSRFEKLAFIFRALTQFRSEERLLPKYLYASPGALYGVQVYAIIVNVEGLDNGTYYLNPQTATLHLVNNSVGDAEETQFVLIGKRSVIASVYKTNIDEVLHFEAGHLLGAVDTVAPAVGYRLGSPGLIPECASSLISENDDNDRFIIGTWPLRSSAEAEADPLIGVDVHVDVYKLPEVDSGFFHWEDGNLSRCSGAPLIRRRDVIAINQRVYDQAHFGLLLTADGGKESYISLGRALQRLQMNDESCGFMSSGYSSFSGRDLTTARRAKSFFGTHDQASYFALGGSISTRQRNHTGMEEDLLHAHGPAEIIRSDVAKILPHYMVPDVINILDELPKLPNGKIDVQVLAKYQAELLDSRDQTEVVAPRNLREQRLHDIWTDLLPVEHSLSVTSPFFSVGGDSIAAVRLVREIQEKLGVALPIQAVFEHETIEKQAQLILRDSIHHNRIVPLAGVGDRKIFLWPGLGGYPMNLRPLARAIAGDQFQCLGVQASGLNPGEEIDVSIQAMATRDLSELREIAPSGPYLLVGYSFGARVAFETAFQLEACGETVEKVVLIAPGSPRIAKEHRLLGGEGLYSDNRFVQVLYSVFFGTITGDGVERVLATARNRCTFLQVVQEQLPIDRELAERIIKLVESTYTFEYSFSEIEKRELRAPIEIIRAAGDDYSFLDRRGAKLFSRQVSLAADHYEMLKYPAVSDTAQIVSRILSNSETQSELTGSDQYEQPDV